MSWFLQCSYSFRFPNRSVGRRLILLCNEMPNVSRLLGTRDTKSNQIRYHSFPCTSISWATLQTQLRTGRKLPLPPGRCVEVSGRLWAQKSRKHLGFHYFSVRSCYLPPGHLWVCGNNRVAHTYSQPGRWLWRSLRARHPTQLWVKGWECWGPYVLGLIWALFLCPLRTVIIYKWPEKAWIIFQEDWGFSCNLQGEETGLVRPNPAH